MDCYLFPGRPGDPRVKQGEYVLTPRNEHPLLLDGYDMARYVPVKLYVIHPYYGSQNSPRQQAGKWVSTVVKFVRDAPSTRRLPFVLVPSEN